jgi:molybdopterin molybdotransferase
VPTLNFDEARRVVVAIVQGLTRARNLEVVDLEHAHGRVLAETVVSDRDYPAVRRSLRDGFAIMSRDVPGTLRVRGEVRAGQPEQPALDHGEALEIMTGAPVPNGADGVVMVEHVTRRLDEHGKPVVQIDRTAEPNQFVNEQGAESKHGSVLISVGTRLDASHIATLAMSGNAVVTVEARPRVAILATGDEIVGIQEQPAPHQVRNSNSYMLATLVRAAGADPTILPVARDTASALTPLLERGLYYDMLIVTGGVSAGKYDLVKPSLRELGVQFHFERVRVQPGQPTAFGTLANKVVFGLPGNPGSTLVTFQLFAQAAIEILAGVESPILPLLFARFDAPFRHKPGLTRFLPAFLTNDGEHLRHIPWQGSSDMPALARANAFLVADHDREAWDIGDMIRVMPKL